MIYEYFHRDTHINIWIFAIYYDLASSMDHPATKRELAGFLHEASTPFPPCVT